MASFTPRTSDVTTCEGHYIAVENENGLQLYGHSRPDDFLITLGQEADTRAHPRRHLHPLTPAKDRFSRRLPTLYDPTS
jgi:hypothetical protein